MTTSVRDVEERDRETDRDRQRDRETEREKTEREKTEREVEMGGYIMPRETLERTFLQFQGSVLTIKLAKLHPPTRALAYEDSADYYSSIA